MVYQKLTNIQTQIKAPKNLYNKFGGYYYRNAESICEAVKPFLEKEKCSLTIQDDIVLIGERYYVKAIVTLTDNEDGSSISVFALSRETNEKKGMDGSQITGATSSYARKYALNGLFLLDDTKDEDSEELHAEKEAKAKQEEKKPAEKKPTTKGHKETPEEARLNDEMRASVDPLLLPTADGKISPEQVAKIESEANRTGVALETILGAFEVESVDKLSDAQAITTLNRLAKHGDKK